MLARPMETDASRTFNFKLLLCSTRRWLRHESFFSSFISIHFDRLLNSSIRFHHFTVGQTVSRKPERDRRACDGIIKTVFIFRSKLIINNKFSWRFLCHSLIRLSPSLRPSSSLPLRFCFAVNTLSMQSPQANANDGRTLHVAGIIHTSRIPLHIVIHFFARKTHIGNAPNKRPAKTWCACVCASVYIWLRFVLIEVRGTVTDDDSVPCASALYYYYD